MSPPLRLGLVLCSPRTAPTPSTRIAVLNVLPALHEAGIQTEFLFEPPTPTETPTLDGVADRAARQGCDAVLLQKVHGEAALQLAQQLRVRGIASVWLVCDLIEPRMVEATDATAVVCDHLRSCYPQALQARMHLVHDGIEHPALFRTEASPRRGSLLHPLKACLVSSSQLRALPVLDRPPPWLQVRICGAYAKGWQRLREISWSWQRLAAAQRGALLAFLLDPRIRRRPWTPEGVYDELLASDLGILPIDTETQQRSWRLKSANRLTLKMAIGLPVIATPIPAYEDIIESGVNGFLARSRADWLAALSQLRDPQLRQRIGRAGRESVLQAYGQALQAQRLIAVLEQAMRHLRLRAPVPQER